MRNRWALRMAAPVLGGALLIGCGGTDDANDDRQAQQPMTNQAEDSDAQATVALSGCVESAPGSDQYVLRNVRFEPRQGEPQRETTTAGAHGITEGAWVRLDGGDQSEALRGFAGQRVMLTGLVEDSGRNTVGTSGASGDETPTGDRSRAATDEDHADKVKGEAGRIARESMADGTAAEVKVTALEPIGENCPAGAAGAKQ